MMMIALGKLLDVGKVVSGQQDRCPSAAIDLFQEFPDAVLGHYVQANRRLIQEKQGRVVEQRGRQVTAHSLAQAELSHRRVEVIFQVENLAEKIQPPAVVRLRDSRRVL